MAVNPIASLLLMGLPVVGFSVAQAMPINSPVPIVIGQESQEAAADTSGNPSVSYANEILALPKHYEWVLTGRGDRQQRLIKIEVTEQWLNTSQPAALIDASIASVWVNQHEVARFSTHNTPTASTETAPLLQAQQLAHTLYEFLQAGGQPEQLLRQGETLPSGASLLTDEGPLAFSLLDLNDTDRNAQTTDLLASLWEQLPPDNLRESLYDSLMEESNPEERNPQDLLQHPKSSQQSPEKSIRGRSSHNRANQKLAGKKPAKLLPDRVLPDHSLQEALQEPPGQEATGSGSSLLFKNLVIAPAQRTFLENYLKHADLIGKSLVGVASWYGPGFHGRRAASGERFDMHALTAAHRTLPFGTLVKVVNPRNGKSCVVKINDRGPFHSGRIIDLSFGAAKAIGMLSTSPVKLEVLARGPIQRYKPPTR